jgi:cell wall-associated NlpC family hydrolase
MRWVNGRSLPTVIGLSLSITIGMDVAAVMVYTQNRSLPPAGLSNNQERLVADSTTSSPTPAASKRLITPHLLVASGRSLPADVIDRVRRTGGVKDVEVVDAARAVVAGKRLGVLGVDPVTFRSYTPRLSAQSDALWRNVNGGDVAISFTMGKDGNVPLGSWTRIGDATRQIPVRVGAYATMGIGQVDAVVSDATARSIGLPSRNALLISAPHTSLNKLRQRLKKVLPKDAKSSVLESRFEGTTPPTGTPNGKVMTAEQVNTVIKAAESKIGMPYVWGGESDREGGYDCSGLLQYAFAKAGIRMPRTADIQAFTGWRLPYSQAQPGDLLTWKNDPTFNGVSHIALYLGNGKMVVARHTGTLITIMPVYLQNFWGAIRVNPQLSAEKAG